MIEVIVSEKQFNQPFLGGGGIGSQTLLILDPFPNLVVILNETLVMNHALIILVKRNVLTVSASAIETQDVNIIIHAFVAGSEVESVKIVAARSGVKILDDERSSSRLRDDSIRIELTDAIGNLARFTPDPHGR
jgi:hypothetical protein